TFQGVPGGVDDDDDLEDAMRTFEAIANAISGVGLPPTADAAALAAALADPLYREQRARLLEVLDLPADTTDAELLGALRGVLDAALPRALRALGLALDASRWEVLRALTRLSRGTQSEL